MISKSNSQRSIFNVQWSILIHKHHPVAYSGFGEEKLRPVGIDLQLFAQLGRAPDPGLGIFIIRPRHVQAQRFGECYQSNQIKCGLQIAIQHHENFSGLSKAVKR